MADQMRSKLEKAIEQLADKINKEVKADEALKYTQAALNAAHTIHVIESEKKK